MKNYLYSVFLILMVKTLPAQTTSLRGLYIDHFNNILGNSVKEDSLLQYAQDSSYNYLAFYDLQSFNLNNASTADMLGTFIKRARDVYGVQYIGAVGESYSTFKNEIGPYNNNRTDDHEKFNVFNLEFEFWTTSSVNPGGYYCTQYLQPGNCSCDSSGGFKFFIKQMHLIDSLAAVQQVLSETYLGWFNQGQASQIQQNADRILLHAYRTNNSSLFSYSKTRLQYLASNNSMTDIAPIFSSEPSFMGSWLDSHAQIEAYTQYKIDFDNDNSSWKQYINILGYHWFDWKFMPKPIPGSFNPVITASGPVTFCSGSTVGLSATSGDSYHWSNGATSRSITVSGSGNYTCDVTINNVTHTTPATVVSVKNIPVVSISEGNLTSGLMPLTANAMAGSGTISTYQWKLNNSDISGATSSTFLSVVSGDYAVEVTNSFGCNTVSAIQTVTLPGSGCNASTPSGLSSTAITEISRMLSWNAGQTGDSIIIRYHPSTGTQMYDYVNMYNIGQSSAAIANLQQNTTYSWQVKTMCGTTSGAWSANAYFTTGILSGIHDVPDAKDANQNEGTIYSFQLYPNPSNENVQIDFALAKSGEGEITLMDINSRIVFKETVNMINGDNKIILNTSGYGNGIYFLSIKNNETVLVQKLIIGH